MRTVYTFVILIACACFWQCSESNEELTQVEIRSSVNDNLFMDSVGLNLKFQEMVRNIQKGWTIQFSELVEESRCPTNVVCIRSGSVTVRLTLTKDGQSENIDLTIGDRGKPNKVVDSFVLDLLAVEPYPEDPATLKTSDYIIYLSIYPQ